MPAFHRLNDGKMPAKKDTSFDLGKNTSFHTFYFQTEGTKSLLLNFFVWQRRKNESKTYACVTVVLDGDLVEGLRPTGVSRSDTAHFCYPHIDGNCRTKCGFE
jgi:hypothetical protein